MRNNERKKEQDVVIAGGELVTNSEKVGKKDLKKIYTRNRLQYDYVNNLIKVMSCQQSLLLCLTNNRTEINY